MTNVSLTRPDTPPPHPTERIHSRPCWSVDCVSYHVLPVTGKYWSHVGPLFLLHMLHVSVAVWACFRIFSQPQTQDVQLNVSTLFLKSACQRVPGQHNQTQAVLLNLLTWSTVWLEEKAFRTKFSEWRNTFNSSLNKLISWSQLFGQFLLNIYAKC